MFLICIIPISANHFLIYPLILFVGDCVLIFLFLFLLGVLSIASLIIGARASQGIKESEDYLLAGRRLGVWSLCLTVIATQVGAGLMLGSSQSAYQSGWPALLWPVGNAVGLLALGLGLGGRLRRLGIRSTAELFELLYQSIALRKIASVVSLLAMMMLLVAQMIGLRQFLLSSGMGGTGTYLLVGAVLIGYTAFGGLRAVVFTDILQASFIGLVLLIVAWMLLPIGLPSWELSSLEGGVLHAFSGWFVGPFLFMMIGQDMGQRCFAGKTDRSVNRAFILAAVSVALIGFVPVWLAVLGKQRGLVIETGDSILLAAATEFTGPVIGTFVGVAVAIALISTIDSLICAVSSIIAVDFGLGSRRLRALQMGTLGIGLFALSLGLIVPSVKVVMLTSYDLAVSLLAVPVMASLVPALRSRHGVIFSLVGGGVGFLLLRFLEIHFPRELCTLGISLTGYGMGWVISRVKRARYA